jgi:hypothetical protein
MDEYFETVNQRLGSGALVPPHSTVRLFPTVIVFTKTPTLYAFELFGARRRYRPLRTKLHEVSSSDVFLGDFKYDGPTSYLITFEPGSDAKRGTADLRRLALSSRRTLDALEARFPGVLNLFPTHLLQVGVSNDVRCTKSFDGSRLAQPLLISNCLITNTLDSIVRARFTNLLVAVPRDIEAQELSGVLRELAGDDPNYLPGVQIVEQGQQESIVQAGQFANLYLQGLQETTLTQFIEDHFEIIKYALNADQIFFQLNLPWRERNPDPTEEAIQPDIIMRQKDGTWFIIDFKLPLLTKASVTTGGHRRRRFIHTIADGIAQLHNYREYFDYKANRREAFTRLREEVQEPQLMIIVGTSENVDLTEVDEAMRALKPIDIVDYDTLIRLFLANYSS